MPRSSNSSALVHWRRLLGRATRAGAAPGGRRALVVRATLAGLLGVNLAMAWFVFHPPGGSLDELDAQIVLARRQIIVRQQAIDTLRRNLEKTSAARRTGDAFLAQYFLPRRHAYSQLETEFAAATRAAQIKAKDRSFNYEAVEGSDTLGMLTVTANFEGTYADLIQFVNQMDRAKRLVIIESLQATPLAGTPMLSIAMKFNAFFRFDGPQDVAKAQAEAHSGSGASTAGAQADAPSSAAHRDGPRPAQLEARR